MKAALRTVFWLTCIALVLFGEISCGQLRHGTAVQDSDCIPPQEMDNLKLFMAAIEGDTETMNTLVKAGADVNASDELFGTPMVGAVYSGKLDALKLLLDKGANPNATSETGCSALIVAALLN